MSQINFSELFKSSHEENSTTTINKSRFILSIGYYFFVMIILASLVFILFDYLGSTSLPSLKETLTPQMEVERLFDSYDNLVILLPNFIIDDFQSIPTYPYDDAYFIIVDDAFDAFIYVDEVKTILPSYILLALTDGTIEVATHITWIPESLLSFDLINTINLNNAYVLTSFANNLLNFIVYILLFPVIFLILAPYIFRDIKDAKAYQPKWLGLIIAGYLYVLAGNIFANVLTQLLYFITGKEESISVNQSIILESLRGGGAFLMILSAVILGPIVEELIFRKAFFGIISNQKIAMVVSSLLFGLIHVLAEPTFLDLVINIIPYVIIGFVFGSIYIKHQKNIFIVTIIHMITNLISIISILFFF